MEECGILVKSDTDNVSCWVFVRKKDETKRPCEDFRLLNEITVPDLFPMPRTDALLEQITGSNKSPDRTRKNHTTGIPF